MKPTPADLFRNLRSHAEAVLLPLVQEGLVHKQAADILASSLLAIQLCLYEQQKAAERLEEDERQLAGALTDPFQEA